MAEGAVADARATVLSQHHRDPRFTLNEPWYKLVVMSIKNPEPVVEIPYSYGGGHSLPMAT